MFKNFTGFNLVEEMHKLRHAKRFNPLKLKKSDITLGIVFVLIAAGIVVIDFVLR